MWEIWVWGEHWGLSPVKVNGKPCKDEDIETFLITFPDCIYFFRMVM